MDPNHLKGPVYDIANFSKMQTVKFSRNPERGAKYLPVNEGSTESIPIESEFRSMLIDYLHCHWIKESCYDDAGGSNKRTLSKSSSTMPSKKTKGPSTATDQSHS